jgi:hypothetical protein
LASMLTIGLNDMLVHMDDGLHALFISAILNLAMIQNLVPILGANLPLVLSHEPSL